MQALLWIGGIALSVLGVTAWCAFLLRRIESRVARKLGEMRNELDGMVRRAVREERNAWAREVLRRQSVADALEAKAGQIRSASSSAFSELSRRMVEQFERDANALRPPEAELREAKHLLARSVFAGD